MDSGEWEAKWRIFEDIEFSSGRKQALEEALKWWHVTSYYIFMTMQANAEENGFTMEDYEYYDGFLSYIDHLLDDYFVNEESNKRLLEHLLNGVGAMVFDVDEEEEYELDFDEE